MTIKKLKKYLKYTLWVLAAGLLGYFIQLAITNGEFLQFLITGISVGMVYALIALGFALIWKSSSVANLALGQIVLISSWFFYSMFINAGLPSILSFLLVIIFAIFLGWVIERVALRRAESHSYTDGRAATGNCFPGSSDMGGDRAEVRPAARSRGSVAGRWRKTCACKLSRNTAGS